MNKNKKSAEKFKVNEKQVPLEELDKEDVNQNDSLESNEETSENVENKVDELEKTQKEVLAVKDQLLRKIAEFDNFRKRTQKDLADARFFSKSMIIEDFLTVFDHFQLAMEHSDKTKDVKSLVDGMKMILSEFTKTFENIGLKKVESLGKVFDPNIHEAMSKEPSSEFEEGIIIKEWKPAYKLNDKLIRPATVVVSSGEESKED